MISDGLGRRRGHYEYLWLNGAWAWNLRVEYVYDGNVVVQERWCGDEPWINCTRGLDVSGTWQGASGVGGSPLFSVEPFACPGWKTHSRGVPGAWTFSGRLLL